MMKSNHTIYVHTVGGFFDGVKTNTAVCCPASVDIGRTLPRRTNSQLSVLKLLVWRLTSEQNGMH